MNGSGFSRRRFLRSTGGAVAAVWIPQGAKGFTAAEMRVLAEEGSLSRRVSKWELDTPALCVDLDAMEHNFRRMRETTRRNGIAFRPHVKTHKTPAIAELQIADGAVGICTAKVSEAEAMVEHGIDRVLMTTSNVTPFKIRRAMELTRRSEEFVHAVDAQPNARDLSDAAREAGVTANVVVDVDPGLHRTGVPADERALDLARLVDRLPNLSLRGMLSYDGSSQHVQGFEARRARALETMEVAADVFRRFERAGLSTEIFSGGGTGTYNIDHETPGFTDVQCGSYLFMDSQYLAIGSADGSERYDDFLPSLTVVTTVLNTHHDGIATTDAGQKALTIHKPDPIVVGETGISYRTWGDEFGRLAYDDPSRTYRVGEKLEVIVPHCDPVVNLYDQIYATRNGLVEEIWPVAARGGVR